MKILIFSNSSSTGQRYGYSVVTTKIAEALRDAGHEIFMWGMQSIHPPYKQNRITYLGIFYDGWGGDCLGDILRAYSIDCMLGIMDIWLPNTQYIPQVCKNLGVFWLQHITANSIPLSPFLFTPISQANMVVAPSKFNQQLVQQSGLRCEYIPHGCDTNVFRPLGEEIKKEMRKKLKIDKEFIFLSVMRNKGQQKNYPGLLQAWRIALQNDAGLQKNAVLVILADQFEPDGIRIDLLRQTYGLQDFVKLINWKATEDGIEPTTEDNPKGVHHNANYVFSAETMAKIYNLADVHVTSSCGESFNLPTLESMACGIPQIAHNFSTAQELIGEPQTGLLADSQGLVTVPLITDIAYVNPISLAQKIIEMYRNKEARLEMGKRAEAFAKGYSWDIVIDRWVELMEKVESQMQMVNFVRRMA